jgi:hypothetical protein
MTTTETRERFLLAIAKEIAPELIAEVHCFQPLRQGGIESGVAVVAADEHPVARLGDPDDGAHGEAVGIAGRFTVYTARYRLVLKGSDRGKWETSVVAEADAPLVTVDAVVRGVQRRSGDVDAPERYSGTDLRLLLGLTG